MNTFKYLFSFLFLLCIFTLLSTPSFASLEDKQFFGITGTEASDSMLNELGIKMFYTWSSPGYTPSQGFGPYTKLLTFRLGKYWWDHSSQAFNTLASPDPNNCNQTIAFSYGGSNYSYPYNKCAIQTKLTSLYNGAGGQSVKYFVIGNEPNVIRELLPGETEEDNDSDGALPSNIPASNTGLAAKYHAEQYRAIYTVINDFRVQNNLTDVKVVGPSMIGFSQSLNNGEAWFNAFVSGYGSLPPMDYLNYHPYDTGLIDLSSQYGEGHFKRRLDATVVANDLAYFRTAMNSAGYSSKEIFLSEFGTPNCAVDKCHPRSETEARDFLELVINNFRAKRVEYKLKGWMLFSLKRVNSGVYPTNPVNLRDQSSNPTVMSNWYKDKIAQEFSDVPPTISPYEKFEKIQKFYLTKETTAGVKIGGCKTVEQDNTGLKKFCIGDHINRQDFAKFLIISLQEATSNATNIFYDIPTVYGPYAMRMQERGITYGCGTNDFCGDDPVTRGVMAIFIKRARQTSSAAANFTIPQTASFPDVAYSSTGELYRSVEYAKFKSITFGITNGCGYSGGTIAYCPNDNVRRDDMAMFLMRAFPEDRMYTTSD